MGMLKITDCTGHHYTSIDNAFIDSYMAEANGEYVKVYLLLLRRIRRPGVSSSLTLTVERRHSSTSL